MRCKRANVCVSVCWERLCGVRERTFVWACAENVCELRTVVGLWGNVSGASSVCWKTFVPFYGSCSVSGCAINVSGVLNLPERLPDCCGNVLICLWGLGTFLMGVHLNKPPNLCLEKRFSVLYIGTFVQASDLRKFIKFLTFSLSSSAWEGFLALPLCCQAILGCQTFLEVLRNVCAMLNVLL